MKTRLGELRKGGRGRIVEIACGGASVGAPSDEGICARLMEIGLLEGSVVEVVHEAPFGGDPIAVRVRGALIALRRNEANHIWVQAERT